MFVGPNCLPRGLKPNICPPRVMELRSGVGGAENESEEDMDFNVAKTIAKECHYDLKHKVMAQASMTPNVNILHQRRELSICSCIARMLVCR